MKKCGYEWNKLNREYGIDDLYGINVFSLGVMKERIPKPIFEALMKTVEEGEILDDKLVADAVATAMKNWAIENGATHYTHWFLPMTGYTAEKHESFVSPVKNGNMIMEFSGKMLMRGEPDASAFPSGGLRATFEARGYTAWDCTSPAFLKEDAAGVTLCIPTAFCSYTGQALDQKTPLLRSMEAVNKSALRVLRLLGDSETKRVIPSVGAEQEYFLVDKRHFDRRLDLQFVGRTLVGAPATKGQEITAHYYGSLKEPVAQFMRELDVALWKMGVAAKTKHNEAAPSQHELASVYTAANRACDENQLVMETMKRIAPHHGLECLLHEKPFENINGSGKHNNWSLTTDRGVNLFEPGRTPQENLSFLVFLCACIMAVDKYAKLVRLSAAAASNDSRLGGYEAPPAIISIFVGDQLTEVLNNIKNGGESSEGRRNRVKFGVPSLPDIYQDTTDRNRTSPFAFTGNKFEFRMLGSSMPATECNTILNTIMADALDGICDMIESGENRNSGVREALQKVLEKHDRIIFNGNGYSDEWNKEALRRGLPNITDTVDAIIILTESETVELFEKHSVLSRDELEARYEIHLKKYSMHVNLEGRTLLEMTNRKILPAVLDYIAELSGDILTVEQVGVSAEIQRDKLAKVTEKAEELKTVCDRLEKALDESAEKEGDPLGAAIYSRDVLLEAINGVRSPCDCLEKLLPADAWPIPTYDEMLYHMI